MDPIEYCKHKNGYCACERGGEVLCASMIREAKDAVHITVRGRDKPIALLDTTPPTRPDDPHYGKGMFGALYGSRLFRPGGARGGMIPLGFEVPEMITIRVPSDPDDMMITGPTEYPDKHEVVKYDEVRVPRHEWESGKITMDDCRAMVRKREHLMKMYGIADTDATIRHQVEAMKKRIMEAMRDSPPPTIDLSAIRPIGESFKKVYADELSYKWPSIYERLPPGPSPKERRTGSIPEDKRKPHHVFLEDPVKRRRK